MSTKLKFVIFVMSVIHMTLLQTIFYLQMELLRHGAISRNHLPDAECRVHKYLRVHWLRPELVPANTDKMNYKNSGKINNK